MSHDPEQSLSPDELARQAYNTAVKLLAFRDHSVAEITQKLTDREHNACSIERAINQLLSDNYLNDTRYAELYAEQRMEKGYGPLSIKANLTKRGIDKNLVQLALQKLSVDWASHAQEVIERRFSLDEIADTEQRITAKIARFMHNRGFTSSDSFRALKKARQERA